MAADGDIVVGRQTGGRATDDEDGRLSVLGRCLRSTVILTRANDSGDGGFVANSVLRTSNPKRQAGGFCRPVQEALVIILHQNGVGFLALEDAERDRGARGALAG